MKLVIDDSIPRALFHELQAAGDLPTPEGSEVLHVSDHFAATTEDRDWLAAVEGPGTAVLLLDCRSQRAAYLASLCRELELELLVFTVPRQRLRLRSLAAWLRREWPHLPRLVDVEAAPFGYQFFQSRPAGQPTMIQNA